MHGKNTIMAKEITYYTTFNPKIQILFDDLAEKKAGGGCFLLQGCVALSDLCLPDSRAYQWSIEKK